MFKLFKKPVIFISFSLLQLFMLTTESYAITSFGFYNKGKAGYELTNFFAASIIEKGTSQNGQPFTNIYKTSEAYFQAKKFNCNGSRHVIAEILAATSPRKAFDVAQKNAHLTRPGWHGNNGKPGIKDSVMKNALRLKFTQNPHLGCLLMATDGLYLFEDSPVDATWGVGKNGKGQNLLGKYLMELRDDLLTGKVKLDWSNKNGAQPTQATLNFLAQNGRLDYYNALIQSKGKAFSLNDHKKQSSSSTSNVSGNFIPLILLNPNYKAVKVKGFGSSISKSIQSRFMGLSGTPKVVITKKKNMLIETANPVEALGLLGVLKLMNVKGVRIDKNNLNNVFIKKNSIDSFMKNVLLFDQKFITTFKQHKDI